MLGHASCREFCDIAKSPPRAWLNSQARSGPRRTIADDAVVIPRVRLSLQDLVRFTLHTRTSKMRIALSLHDGLGLASGRFVSQLIDDALRFHHAVIELPRSFDYAPPDVQNKIAADVLEECDVIVGYQRTIGPLLRARGNVSRHIPCILFVLGSFPRGAAPFRALFPLLTEGDALVVSSRADALLVRQFAPTARVALIPYAYDETTFYPISEEERREARTILGLDEQCRIVLYAGRLTVEKNLHTLLRVFAEVSRRVPRAHLVIAGEAQDVPFEEIGVRPVGYEQTLKRLARSFNIPPDRCKFLGSAAPDTLRLLFNIADAAVNLTLHHSECFGLSQVEAHACRCPVVGTAWGGLKDTIIPGVNGYTIRTVVTPFGVKIDWWEAVIKLSALLLADADATLAARAQSQSTSQRFTKARLCDALNELIAGVCDGASLVQTRLTVSSFASHFWATCLSASSGMPEYVHDTASFDCYRQMIEQYAHAGLECVAGGLVVSEEHVLCTPAPLIQHSSSTWSVDDPLYPFGFECPPEHAPGLVILSDILRREPVISVGRLKRLCGEVSDAVLGTIEWMLSLGLLLRTDTDSSWLPLENGGVTLDRAPFSIQTLDSSVVDFLVDRRTRSVPNSGMS